MKANKANMVLSGLAVATAVFLGLVFLANDYSVQTDYLVIQGSADKQDFYTLSKSVEYSGNILKEAIASDLFFSEAANTKYFDASVFPSDELEKLKEWRKSIKVTQRSGAGILEVTVKRRTQSEALGIARAVSDVLIQKNNLFRSGTPESLTIKTISGPIVEQNPTIKQLITGSVAGFILGVALFLLWKLSRGPTVSKKSDQLFFSSERELDEYRNRLQVSLEISKGPFDESLVGEGNAVPENLPHLTQTGYTQ